MADEHYDPTDIDGQLDAAADREEQLRVAREREASDIQWLMSSRRGRRVMARILEIAPPFDVSYRPKGKGEGMVDALEMAFNEGVRNVGIQLYGRLTGFCHELYLVMVKEQNDGKRNGNGKQRN